MAEPLAYFLTWHTYGTWLHGDERGSVDRTHRVYSEPFVGGNVAREGWEKSRLLHPPIQLDELARRLVQETTLEVCRHRSWRLLCVHVRTTHVHAVVAADATPERLVNDFKSYATRCLRAQRVFTPTAKLWSRHGSTKHLWTEDQVWSAIRYSIDEQGPALDPRPHVADDFRR